MSVVEAGQPLTVRSMQRERVVDSMWLLWRHWHPRHDEPDPMTALRVDHEDLPVKIEKDVEGRIGRPCHDIQLSY